MEVPIDICFCVDATESTGPVINALKERILNITADIDFSRRPGMRLSKKYALIAYRDPVDRPRNRPGISFPDRPGWDEHELHDFGGEEALQEFLGTLKAYGGGDEPEDWAGAIELALNRLSWRDGKKAIIWVADANAHGPLFALETEYDRHPEEENRLVALIHELVRRNIYFIGVNVMKNGDLGCRKTFSAIKAIYQDAGGKPVSTQDFVVAANRDGEFVDPNEDFDADLLLRLEQSVVGQMSAIVAAMTADLV